MKRPILPQAPARRQDGRYALRANPRRRVPAPGFRPSSPLPFRQQSVHDIPPGIIMHSLMTAMHREAGIQIYSFMAKVFRFFAISFRNRTILRISYKLCGN
ncbi:MAG: hypothetical protein PUD16_02010 [bacterium]|nr:hypothetical protein [bacterium]